MYIPIFIYFDFIKDICHVSLHPVIQTPFLNAILFMKQLSITEKDTNIPQRKIYGNFMHFLTSFKFYTRAEIVM